MTLVRNFILMPSLAYRVGGPIALGNIIADPFRPHKVLTTPDANSLMPAVETVTHHNYQIVRDTDQEVNAGVWTKFIRNFNINVGAGNTERVITSYKMDALKTSYFETELTHEEISRRVNNPLVQTIIKSGYFGNAPVFMIVALKFAQGLSVRIENSSNRATNAGGLVNLASGTSAMAGVKLSAGNSQLEMFDVGEDIVFAYQLIQIVQKRNTVEFDDYQPKAGFLSIDPDEEGKEEGGEIVVGYVTAADLDKANVGGSPLGVVEVPDSEGTCICISFDKNYFFD